MFSLNIEPMSSHRLLFADLRAMRLSPPLFVRSPLGFGAPVCPALDGRAVHVRPLVFVCVDLDVVSDF